MSQQGDLERQKRLQLQREDAIRAHDRAQEFETKTNEATVASGQVAIRMAILINGGAAITILGLDSPPECMDCAASSASPKSPAKVPLPRSAANA